MMEAPKQHRGTLAEASLDQSKAGTKRLFSNRESGTPANVSEHGGIYENEDEDDFRSGKKHRRSEWPLCTNQPDSTPRRAPVRNQNRNRPHSPPSQSRPTSSQARPSRFLEGSMNDRVSKKPPTTYVGEEEILERYDHEIGETQGRKLARPETFTQHSDASVIGSSADRSEVSRHSSIVRFGKSLAASFNPSNWKIFSKVPEETEESADQQILRERKEKAESMYQQLKESGHFRDSTFGPSLFQHHSQKESVIAKHDSGVDFSERRSRSISRMSRMSNEMSKEEKRMGRIFLEPPQLPTGSESHFSQSPGSTPQQSTKAKFHFKKPSLSNIRKSFSDNGSNVDGHHQARRIPSRKDLQKQQRLVKRVSDLEGKLEAARRQLSDALSEPVPSGPPPRRARFVPGAMPSLPSERLLNGFDDSENGVNESVSVTQIGKALTRDESIAQLHGEKPDWDESTRGAAPSPNLDKSLPLEPDAPSYDRIIQSVEVEETELREIDTSDAQNERSAVQSLKSRQASIIKKSASPTPQLTDHFSELSNPEDSEYERSESEVKHDTSPKILQNSQTAPSKPHLKIHASYGPSSVSRKRKSTSGPDSNSGKKLNPIGETESEGSSMKLEGASKVTGANPPRKLRKTSNAKTSPQSQQSAATQRRQLTPRKRQSSIASRFSKSKIPVKGRQSVSPPASASFAISGLDYKKPSSSHPTNEGEFGEDRMGTYDPTPSADDSDVPPVPKIPKTIRMASGEIINIPETKGHSHGPISGEGGNSHHPPLNAGKLTKARPTPSAKVAGEERKSASPRKSAEQFEWPEDVF